MYASFLGMSGALHLDIFRQPAHKVFLSNLLVLQFAITLRYFRDRNRSKKLTMH